MTEIDTLDFAGLANLQAQIAAAMDAQVAARDTRYAKDASAFFSTVVEEIPITETPTSFYAGHRVAFEVTLNDRKYLAQIDLRDLARSAERKAAAKATEEKAEPVEA